MVNLSVNKKLMAELVVYIPLKKLDLPWPLEPRTTLMRELRLVMDWCS
jgi:hypothetical protein